MTSTQPVTEPGHKQRLSRGQKLMRLLGSVFDPRAYGHGLRLINYHNNTHVKPRRAAKIGAAASISPTVTFAHGEFIELGDHVHLNTGSALWAGPTRGRIVLGDHVLFGPEVFVITSNYRFNDGAPVNDQAMDEADVSIGNDVWVGAKSVILPGTVLGEGCIVGAGAVVRGTYPPYSIIAGNPGKVMGSRRQPNAGPVELGAPNAAVDAIIARELPNVAHARLEGPVEQSGVDSFDLMTLRSAIESLTGVSIPDREWSGSTRLADIARLPSLAGAREGTAPVSTGGADPRATRAPLAPMTGGASASVTADGRSRREMTLNMPQMALSGLSEAWIFKELGDIHWAMITAFLQTPSSKIADDLGDRLYATFTRLVIEADPMLRAFDENDQMAIDSTLSRYGASFFMADHALSTSGAGLRARTMSTFAKYGERGKNTSLVKGSPTLPDPDAIPPLGTFPDFGAEYRARRAEQNETTIFECEYEILPPHDINGVGLLYFAAYPTVFDLCLEQAEGKGFLMGHSTAKKDICYFANSEPDETLLFRLHERAEADGIVRHVASLYRKGDGKRMAEVISDKRTL